jgi:hypothetical protein
VTATANITAEYDWHIYSRKDVRVRVFDEAGSPVDLSGIDLIWRVARDANGSAIYLTKGTEEEAITVEADESDPPGTSSVAVIRVEPDEYDGFPGPGYYWHELRDLTSQLLLSVGDVVLLPAMPLPEEAP